MIGSGSTSEQERAYAAATAGILSGALTTANAVVNALAGIYPSDESFKSSFAEKRIRTTQTRNRGIVRYMLCELEKHLSKNDFDFDSATFNIEHVFPEHPPTGWEEFPDQESDNYAYRLGNMTLLRASENRDLANRSYAEKRRVYETSNFGITRELAAKYAEWSPELLAGRQRWMANQVASLWRIPQLS